VVGEAATREELTNEDIFHLILFSVVKYDTVSVVMIVGPEELEEHFQQGLVVPKIN
jgi:hypothetical protein